MHAIAYAKDDKIKQCRASGIFKKMDLKGLDVIAPSLDDQL
jgi:hypothetical protein